MGTKIENLFCKKSKFIHLSTKRGSILVEFINKLLKTNNQFFTLSLYFHILYCILIEINVYYLIL